VAESKIEGLINVDKGRGPTSHDVVDMARRVFGIQRVGHAGTLDPAAHGVLLLLLGRSTRLARFFADYNKEYRVVVKLGAETSTGDDQGDVLYERKVTAATYDALPAVVRSFVGDVVQRVPKFSAVKREGEPLYRKARRGEDVEAPTRTVRVYRFDVGETVPPTFTAVIECGGGTYVRALARDVGRKLGVGAHVVDLERLAVGPFRIAEALAQDILEKGALDEILAAPHYTRAAALLPELPAARLSEAEVADVAHGRPVAAPAPLADGAPVRLLAPDGSLVGVGLAAAEGRVQPDTVLITPQELGDI
jgi:tRNA pseudouridine55 synthase